MNPPGAENFLTPGPEAFPKSLIHSTYKPKGKTLERCQHGKFFGGGFRELSNVQRPTSNIRFAGARVLARYNLRLSTLDIGHWTLDFGLSTSQLKNISLPDDEQ